MPITTLIVFLNTLPPEFVWLIQLVGCYVGLLLMLRLFGFSGLFVFIAIVIIAANIEVLKVVKFTLFSHPIALGTVFFSSAYVATDILTEYYGPSIARRGILMGFAGSILMLLCMTLGLGFKPLTALQAAQMHVWHTAQIQPSLLNLFNPTPALLGASLISYLISQYSDVWIFKTIRNFTGRKALWFRTNLSTGLSALLDSIIFNVLAWRILTPHPVDWQTLFYTYMLATYVIRLIISALGTPAIYLARYALPRTKHDMMMQETT